MEKPNPLTRGGFINPIESASCLTMGDQPVLLLWTWLGEFGGRNWWWHQQKEAAGDEMPGEEVKSQLGLDASEPKPKE
ncbi:MAG: hypothetical protein CM1200mP39_25300 [Dehalococcoidia bacterium]|nr:MAG: hypothetical protein CM1200mP39_25300 [Dehalococcoidia bacterium]